MCVMDVLNCILHRLEPHLLAESFAPMLCVCVCVYVALHLIMACTDGCVCVRVGRKNMPSHPQGEHGARHGSQMSRRALIPALFCCSSCVVCTGSDRRSMYCSDSKT